jgi:hypothetical protein
MCGLRMMPIRVDINKKSMIENFEKFMQNMSESNFENVGIPDFYIVSGVYSSYIIHYTIEFGVTAFMLFSQGAIDNENMRIPIIQQSDTLNNKKIIKGFTITAFKEISKTFKRPILIDYRNSLDMETTFKKWIDNPEKYGIKNLFVYDNKMKKLLKDGNELEDEVWYSTPQSNRYSILFDFFDYIAECQLDLIEEQLKMEKYRGTKIFFDRVAFEKRNKGIE